MITLKQAISLLDLSDSDMVYICREHLDQLAPHLTIKQIREKYDMKKTEVIKIYPNHYRYSDSSEWELIIK